MTIKKTKNIILCGFMGTGKSTVGQLLASRMGWRFVDTDKLIESRHGKSIPQIFAQEGEPAFRALEHALCEEIGTWKQTVISTGGGIVVDPENRAALINAGLVVCLDAPPDEIAKRLLAADQPERPMLAGGDPAQRIAELMATREVAYHALPHRINTVGITPNHIADQIVNLWKRTTQA